MTSKTRTALAALLFAVIAGSATYWAYQAYQALKGRLDAAEPRFARQVGLQAAKLEMQKHLDQSTALLARYTYPSATDISQAANDAQQRVRTVFTQAGSEVLSLQVLAARGGPQFDAIPLSIRVDGELSQLQAALLTLRTLAPVVYVEGFSVQTGAISPDNNVVKVVGQFELFVLRDQTP